MQKSKRQMHGQKPALKTLFVSVLGGLVLSGCAQNVDLRQEAREKKTQTQEQKSIASMQGAVDLSPAVARTPVKILFVGDMMFDRHIREAVGKYGHGDYGYVLEPVKEKLAGYDLVVANLEGPITENKSVSAGTDIGEGANMVFTFDPAVADVLVRNNIRLVNLGNNHILNQGEKGLEETKGYLDGAGVKYFDGGDYAIEEINGAKIAFVGYNYSESGEEENSLENIGRAENQADFVIVLPHWGAEYKTGDPGPAVRALAYRFADAGPPRVDERSPRVEAGADAIIGTHPHVVEDSEDYNGKKIYYSLGNFVFDQYFQPETMKGLGVEMTLSPDGTAEYGELDFEMTKRGQTKLMQNENIKIQSDN